MSTSFLATSIGDWEEVIWQDVLTIKNGKNQKNVIDPNGKYPIYGSGGEMGRANDYLCDEGTTIIGRKGSINKPLYVNEKFWNVDTAFGLCTSEKLDKKFFYYFCTTYNFLKHNKATTLPSLTKADLLKIKMVIPPLAEQQKIAAILDAADSLRQKDQQLVECYTALSQSLFLEMFGDPVTNPMGWKQVLLENISEIVSGVTKGRKLNSTQIFDIPYMRVANVQDGYLNLTEIKTIPGNKEDLDKYLLRKGDVLLTEGGDPDKLGRGAVWNDQITNCIHQNHIFRVRLTTKTHTPLYLSKLCGSEYGKRYFLKSGKQTTGIASINKTQLKRFPVLCPPIELQNKFVHNISLIEEQKQQAQASLEKSEALFNSLLQRAFTGELTAKVAA